MRQYRAWKSYCEFELRRKLIGSEVRTGLNEFRNIGKKNIEKNVSDGELQIGRLVYD